METEIYTTLRDLAVLNEEVRKWSLKEKQLQNKLNSHYTFLLETNMKQFVEEHREVVGSNGRLL
jgi:hypothetical protein